MNTAFHPKRQKNIRRVWEAEQAEKNKEKHAKERAATLKKERMAMEDGAAPSGLGDVANRMLSNQQIQELRNLHSVSFMYRAPPGLHKPEEKEEDPNAAEEEEEVDDKGRKKKKKLTYVLYYVGML